MSRPVHPFHLRSALSARVEQPSALSSGAGAWFGSVADEPAATAVALIALPLPEQAALLEAWQARLASGLHGLCFSPYLDGQGPGSQLGEAQIRARLALVSPHTRWVRSFSCTDGNELIPRIAKAMGLHTLVGAWLGTDADINEREIAAVIELARAGQADIVAVGNEVLLREDLSEDELLAFIHRVKAALPGVQVGYVDAYYLFELHPRVTAACDVLLANCYPFWEGCAQEQALGYMQAMYRRTLAVADGKPVLISETGWPHIGSAVGAALPSEAAAIRYFLDSCEWAEQEQIPLFYFSAFDESWKVGTEGDVGAYWGVWDALGQLKYSGASGSR